MSYVVIVIFVVIVVKCVNVLKYCNRKCSTIDMLNNRHICAVVSDATAAYVQRTKQTTRVHIIARINIGLRTISTNGVIRD